MSSLLLPYYYKFPFSWLKNSAFLSSTTLWILFAGSAVSMRIIKFIKSLSIAPSRKWVLVCGWNLKKSVVPGFMWRILKYVSLLSAEWNGGAPKARMKNKTPKEKISAGTPKHGESLELWTSGAIYAIVPSGFATYDDVLIANPKSQSLSYPVEEINTFSSLISMWAY